MNCIFCHNISDTSNGVEHIVPESLGNRHIVLWKGAVCDKCNNYFATKIEKPLLDQPYFISVRHRNVIKTKKNKFTQQKAMLINNDGNLKIVSFEYDGNNGLIAFDHENNDSILLSSGKLIVPMIIEPELNNYLLSRFLAKCAFEYLVFCSKEENFIEFSNYFKEKQFELLRKYARYGEGCKMWPYSQRRIYGEGDIFTELNEIQPYEILNEMDFLAIELERKFINGIEFIITELYYILVIMGIEYAIQIAEPDISGYNLWLKKNDFESPIFRYGEKRTPNHNFDTPQITEKIIKRIKNE